MGENVVFKTATGTLSAKGIPIKKIIYNPSIWISIIYNSRIIRYKNSKLLYLGFIDVLNVLKGFPTFGLQF